LENPSSEFFAHHGGEGQTDQSGENRQHLAHLVVSTRLSAIKVPFREIVPLRWDDVGAGLPPKLVQNAAPSLGRIAEKCRAVFRKKSC
jgi:hypothetical protein